MRRIVWPLPAAALLALVASAGGVSAAGNAGTAMSAADLGGMDQLVAAAKEEGELNTIALPPDWANYGEIMKTFQDKYGITINNANPNGSSAEENQAVKSLKGQDRAPDVLDVRPGFAPRGKGGGLY